MVNTFFFLLLRPKLEYIVVVAVVVDLWLWINQFVLVAVAPLPWGWNHFGWVLDELEDEVLVWTA
jgi:hypothetical protein